MLRRLHWIVLRRLPGPFFGWLGTLMFLLLMQFLIRWLPEIAGKGIPVPVIIELIAYNLAYMVVLAVPMSVLLAALMAFGELAESQYYTVIKSTGISFGQIVWPTLVVALLLMGGMLYFNNVMLPEANHRARQLWSDIRGKRPGFELRSGIFYEDLEDYSILVRDRPSGTNDLIDVTIYDYTQGRDRQAVIKAERGVITSNDGGARLTLTLRNGEMHRPLPADASNRSERYERLTFDRHRIQFTLSNAVFRRSTSGETSRSTRTMRTPQLLATLDSLKALRDEKYQSLYEQTQDQLSPWPPDSAATDTSAPAPVAPTHSSPYLALADLDDGARRSVVSPAVQNARSAQSTIQNIQRDTKWQTQRIRSYQVEFYKKFSIALACLIFMIVGAPLGLALRRGGLATIGAVALGIFMFYWVTLVQGEKLAERGFFPPWLGMWIANFLMSGAGLWLILYVVLDLGATPPLRRRLWDWLRSLRS
ncbi:LptF/LptG family permease [Salinibacter altiplanensis]|uniref:LptF/LptG family permease n=1 Tax=Salinibacter altiplanensis TaxID=1803181 RepID=UPI000C9F2265|nr:LptF/LptG family permease [Salinibacter altiplanensis]